MNNPGQLSLKRIASRLTKAADTDAEEEITAPGDSIPDAFDRQEHSDEEAIHTAQEEPNNQDKIEEIKSKLEQLGFKLSSSYPVDFEDGVVSIHLADGSIDLGHLKDLQQKVALGPIAIEAADELSLRLTFDMLSR